MENKEIKNIKNFFKESVSVFNDGPHTNFIKKEYEKYIKYSNSAPPEFKSIIQSVDLVFKLSVEIMKIIERYNKELINAWKNTYNTVDNNERLGYYFKDYKLNYPVDFIRDIKTYIRDIVYYTSLCCKFLSKGNNVLFCKSLFQEADDNVYATDIVKMVSKHAAPAIKTLIYWYKYFVSQTVSTTPVPWHKKIIFKYTISNKLELIDDAESTLYQLFLEVRCDTSSPITSLKGS